MRLAWIALLAAGLAACMPVRDQDWIRVPLRQDQTDAGSDDRIKPGELVEVQRLDKTTQVLQVIRLDHSGFVGVTGKDAIQTVLFKDLRRIRVRRWHWKIVTG